MGKPRYVEAAIMFTIVLGLLALAVFGMPAVR